MFPTLVKNVGFIMMIVGIIQLTTRVLVGGRERISLGENHTVLHLTKGRRRIQMRKSQVGEGPPLLSSVSGVASWTTMLMSARIMF